MRVRPVGSQLPTADRRGGEELERLRNSPPQMTQMARLRRVARDCHARLVSLGVQAARNDKRSGFGIGISRNTRSERRDCHGRRVREADSPSPPEADKPRNDSGGQEASSLRLRSGAGDKLLPNPYVAGRRRRRADTTGDGRRARRRLKWRVMRISGAVIYRGGFRSWRNRPARCSHVSESTRWMCPG